MKSVTILILLALLTLNYSAYGQKEYYSLSDKQYDQILKTKGKKEITLKNGDIGYLMTYKELKLASSIDRDVLDALIRAICSRPLEPGDVCESDCRKCPEGYICANFERPSIRRYLEPVVSVNAPTIKERGEKTGAEIFIIRPGVKKCIALPNR